MESTVRNMNFLMRKFSVFCVFNILVYAEEISDDACDLAVTVVSNDELKDSYLSGCYNMIATVNDRPAYKVSFFQLYKCLRKKTTLISERTNGYVTG